MNRNYNIDKIKLTANLMVVFMHIITYLPRTGYANFWTFEWYFPILNLAVPLFFVFAGYFLSNKPVDKILPYALKTLTTLIAYSLLYIAIKYPLSILSNYKKDLSGLDLFISYFNNISFINMINGTVGSEHLWYLAALSIGVLILYLLRKINIDIETIFIGSFIFFLLTFFKPLNYLSDNILLYGGFAKGLFYVAMGTLIGEYEEKVSEKYRYILIVSFLGLIIINSLIKNLLVEELTISVVVFYTLLYFNKRPGKADVFSNFSQNALGIYLLHIIFTGIFNAARERYNIIHEISPLIIVPLVMLICITGSIILYPYTEYIFHKPVKNIINQLFKKDNND